MLHTLRVVAVNIGLILAVLVAAELFFGTWLFGPSFGSLNLPRDISRRFDVGALRDSEGPAVYTVDRFGLRGRYESPSQIGILAVGGSTTNERYVSDDEIWTARLAWRLDDAGIPLNVVNAGIEGQSTAGHIRNFDAWFPLIPDLKFRYLLAYIGINDIALGPRGANPTQEAFDRIESPDRLRRFRQYLANHSALYRLWRIAKGYQKARIARVFHTRIEHRYLVWVESPEPDIAPLAESGDFARRLDRYAARVNALIRRARERGAEAIIVTQGRANWRREAGRLLFAQKPDGTPDTNGYAETVLFNRAAMAACRAANAICVDLEAGIEFKPGDFYDHVHTTPQGSARIADFLFARLKDKVR